MNLNWLTKLLVNGVLLQVTFLKNGTKLTAHPHIKKIWNPYFFHNINWNLMIQGSFSPEQFSWLKMCWVIEFLLIFWEKNGFQVFLTWGWGVSFLPFFKKVTCTNGIWTIIGLSRGTNYLSAMLSWRRKQKYTNKELLSKI